MTIFILNLSHGLITFLEALAYACLIGLAVYLPLSIVASISARVLTGKRKSMADCEFVHKAKIEIFIDRNGDTQFCLLEEVECFRGGARYVIPVGFVSDGASIPRVFWRILDPKINARTLNPSVKHDFYYRTPRIAITRSQADLTYYKELLENGYNEVKSLLVYIGVRIGGRLSYKKRETANG